MVESKSCPWFRGRWDENVCIAVCRSRRGVVGRAAAEEGEGGIGCTPDMEPRGSLGRAWDERRAIGG